MMTSALITTAVVGVLVFFVAAGIGGRGSGHWRSFVANGPYSAAQLRAASSALRDGKFTVEDPIVRIILLERAREVSWRGVPDLVAIIFIYTGAGAAICGLYLFGSIFVTGPIIAVFAIVLQVSLALLLAIVIVAQVRRIRHAKAFLAP